MKLYKTVITPVSNFATPLMGDTLFGQICWAIRYLYGNSRLNELLENYKTEPFLIISDSMPNGYLPKPSLPSSFLGEDSKKKKDNRKKIWLTLDELQNGDFLKARRDEDIDNEDETIVTIRNSINYKTFKTEKDRFTPYGEVEIKLSPKDVYFLIDEKSFTLKKLEESLGFVKDMGYGKDTTIGKGRFEFSPFEEVNLKRESTTFMSLSPFSPQGLKCKDIFYEPFTKFGKHGAELANKNPFKRPLLLANSRSVVLFEETKDIQYLGKAIKGHSAFNETVHQGFSIVVPIKELL